MCRYLSAWRSVSHSPAPAIDGFPDSRLKGANVVLPWELKPTDAVGHRILQGPQIIPSVRIDPIGSDYRSRAISATFTEERVGLFRDNDGTIRGLASNREKRRRGIGLLTSNLSQSKDHGYISPGLSRHRLDKRANRLAWRGWKSRVPTTKYTGRNLVASSQRRSRSAGFPNRLVDRSNFITTDWLPSNPLTEKKEARAIANVRASGWRTHSSTGPPTRRLLPLNCG
jgi:hypothetical protein